MTPDRAVSHTNRLKSITWKFTWYGKKYIEVHYRRIFEYGGSKKNRNIWQSGAIMARVKQKGKLGMWNLNFGRKNEDSQLHFHALETKVHKVMVFRRAKVVKSLIVSLNERYNNNLVNYIETLFPPNWTWIFQKWSKGPFIFHKLVIWK